jgi:predicted Holliday junction resolvase-like endonuclease
MWIGYRLGSIIKDQEWKENLPKLKQESVKRSREVLTGQFTEQLAPYMPDFPYSPTECRFIGKPIDFIVFKGMDSGEPEEIIFVEVKSGESKLSEREKKLKDVVEKKKISWFEYKKK